MYASSYPKRIRTVYADTSARKDVECIANAEQRAEFFWFGKLSIGPDYVMEILDWAMENPKTDLQTLLYRFHYQYPYLRDTAWKAYEALKAAEPARRAALTPEERAAEDRQKRAAAEDFNRKLVEYRRQQKEAARAKIRLWAAVAVAVTVVAVKAFVVFPP